MSLNKKTKTNVCKIPDENLSLNGHVCCLLCL
jgi:hypothetical protein